MIAAQLVALFFKRAFITGSRASDLEKDAFLVLRNTNTHLKPCFFNGSILVSCTIIVLLRGSRCLTGRHFGNKTP